MFSSAFPDNSEEELRIIYPDLFKRPAGSDRRDPDTDAGYYRIFLPTLSGCGIKTGLGFGVRE